MCFGCLGFNHFSRSCTRKRICKVCDKKHPTVFHDPSFQVSVRKGDYKNDVPSEQSEEIGKVSTASTRLASKSSSSTQMLQAIIPVKVRQRSTGKMIGTYALYDNASSACFITEDLRDQLHAKSTDMVLKLQTLHGSEYIDTSCVSDLEVMSFTCENPIQLPKTYTRQEIPVDRDQIPRREVFQQCPHLACIVDELPPYFPHLSIGLLIGVNCPRALEPVKVIPAEGNGPFAVLYRHGWTINGPVQLSYDSHGGVYCHRIVLKDVQSFKECVCPEAVLKMMELDFSERDVGSTPGEKGLSLEDKRFLKIADEEHKLVNGHYQLPLPFKDDQDLPNNRNQAVSRAMWQKKKMMKDEKYHKDYVVFMESYSAKDMLIRFQMKRLIQR